MATKKEEVKKPVKKAEPKTAKPAPKTVKPAPKTAKPAPKAAKAEAKTAKPAPKTAKPAPKEKEEDMVYHISKRKEDRMWQVKAEGASKALKLFFTQDEAISYAKKVAGNREGRIVIHKEDGSFRRLSY